MCLSGAIAGLGGASQEGDFAPQTRPDRAAELVLRVHGHRRRGAARYNPLAVVPVAVLIGGLQNAGYTLQGADFRPGSSA